MEPIGPTAGLRREQKVPPVGRVAPDAGSADPGPGSTETALALTRALLTGQLSRAVQNGTVVDDQSGVPVF